MGLEAPVELAPSSVQAEGDRLLKGLASVTAERCPFALHLARHEVHSRPATNAATKAARYRRVAGGRTGLPPPPPPAPYRLPALTRPPAAWRSAARSAQRGPIPPPSEGAGRSGAELAAARAPGGRGGEGGAPPRGGRQRGAALVVRLTRVAQAG